MRFKDIFTEYNEEIEKSIELDPLGFGSIWRYYGQSIFENKITSSTFNIRNFNINLFNHYVIKQLMESESNELKDLFMMNPKETIEKLLIVLENIVVYSWYKDRYGDQWNKTYLSGTSKAVAKWILKHEINLNIKNDFKELELLKNQKTTGVNGTHKGAFISMNFFSKNYDNYMENSDDVRSLIEENKELKELFTQVIDFFQKEFLYEKEIPENLSNQYTRVFASHKDIGEYSKNFWKKRLGFESKEAKTIYDIVEDSMTTKEVFEKANSIYESKQIKSEKFKNILSLEPKLAYCEVLFNYLLQCDGEKVEELDKKEFFCFDKINFDKEIQTSRDTLEDIGTTSIERLKLLNDVLNVEEFIKYHQKIMKDRDEQNPWIEKVAGNTIKVNNLHMDLEEEDEETLKKASELQNWGSRKYYLNSVLSIKKDLEK